MSRDFEQIFGQIVSLRIKTLGNINTVASRLTRRENGSLPVDVRGSKTSLLKLPNCTRSGTSTGSEDFFLLICLDAIQFVLLSIFTLVEAI